MEFKSKTDVISAYLREKIITGQLAGGARLLQRQLAAEFGVSPTPVREALRRLETEGLVHYDLHRGATVIGGALGSTDENYWVRAALEPFAARLAAIRITDDELTELDRIHHELMDAIRDSSDRDVTFAEHNRRFHFYIYTASRSPLLLALLRLLWHSFTPLGPPSVRTLEESAAEHQLIVDALRAHDATKAEEHTRRHILSAVGYQVAEDGSYVKRDDVTTPADAIFSAPPRVQQG